MDSNNAIILQALTQRAGQGLTQADAIKDFGVYRLSGRIYDLRAMGHDITTLTEPGITRNGKRCRYARYVLATQTGVPAC